MTTMTIEVRQMTIKSTVQQDATTGQEAMNSCLDFENLREEILADCRRLIIELLHERRER